MPLTQFQRDVLAIISANRSDDSHFAGGVVINREETSIRYSKDFDIFHEAESEVARASNQDIAALEKSGMDVHKLQGEWTGPCSFRRAYVQREHERLEIDWAVDSAFRFFPIEADPILGWRLHLFDAATNKALTLASRSATRDYVDMVALREHYPLAAILWAACGKDLGFTPLSLLEMMKRFARINPHQLATIQARELDPIELKTQWIKMTDEAEEQITELANTQSQIPIGVAFVDEQGQPAWLGDDSSLKIHKPRVRGCWPTLRES